MDIRQTPTTEPPFERHTRNRMEAEAAYTKNPLDADNLTSWGTALLELASHESPRFARKMLRDAISKFEESLRIDHTRSKTCWGLGRAFTALALLSPHVQDAPCYFSKATNYLEMACVAEPDNGLYRESLEMARVQFKETCEWKPHFGLYPESVEMDAKAPAFHMHKCTELAATKKEKSSALKYGAATRKEQSSAVKYGIMCLVSLVGAAVAWVGFSKKQMPLLHPRRTQRG